MGVSYGGITELRKALLSNSRTTDSRDAAKSAELHLRCEPHPAACALQRMISMSIDIPDDFARRLEVVAAAQKKPSRISREAAGSLIDRPTSPQAILKAARDLPHPSPAAVDDLDAAIASSRLPVREQGIFDTRSEA